MKRSKSALGQATPSLSYALAFPCAAALALAFAAPACATKDEDAAPATEASEPACPEAPYAVSGPFSSGVTMLDANGVATEVWYPIEKSAAAGKAKATYDMRAWLPEAERAKISDAIAPIHTMNAYRDVPVARGAAAKFPIVLFSHGLGGYRMQTSFLMAHLASWGFVAVAPEHFERGLAVVLGGDFTKIDTTKGPDQLRAALARVREEGRAGGLFDGVLDADRIAVTGHSMGGAAASVVAADPGVRGAVMLASPGYGELPSGQPSLFLWGASDAVASQGSIDQSYQKQPSPRRSIGIAQAGHLAFSDLCAIGADRGGVLKIASDNGIAVSELVMKLGNDGCGVDGDGKPYLAPEKAWRLVDHYVTAHVRASLGIDAAPVGLGAGSIKCFGVDVATLTEN